MSTNKLDSWSGTKQKSKPEENRYVKNPPVTVLAALGIGCLLLALAYINLFPSDPRPQAAKFLAHTFQVVLLQDHTALLRQRIMLPSGENPGRAYTLDLPERIDEPRIPAGHIIPTYHEPVASSCGHKVSAQVVRSEGRLLRFYGGALASDLECDGNEIEISYNLKNISFQLGQQQYVVIPLRDQSLRQSADHFQISVEFSEAVDLLKPQFNVFEYYSKGSRNLDFLVDRLQENRAVLSIPEGVTGGRDINLRISWIHQAFREAPKS